MTDQAADRKNVPKLWDLMKKRGNKKKHDYDPVKERERMKKLYRTTIYDENGERIVMDNDMNENDDYDKEMLERDYEENNYNNNDDDNSDDDDSGDGGSDSEEKELTDAIKERNQRIKEKNREEEEISIVKQQNKKLGRNVMIRTLSGKSRISNNFFSHLFIVPHFFSEMHSSLYMTSALHILVLTSSISFSNFSKSSYFFFLLFSFDSL
jgi:hypothetical protein